MKKVYDNILYVQFTITLIDVHNLIIGTLNEQNWPEKTILVVEARFRSKK